MTLKCHVLFWTLHIFNLMVRFDYGCIHVKDKLIQESRTRVTISRCHFGSCLYVYANAYSRIRGKFMFSGNVTFTYMLSNMTKYQIQGRITLYHNWWFLVSLFHFNKVLFTYKLSRVHTSLEVFLFHASMKPSFKWVPRAGATLWVFHQLMGNCVKLIISVIVDIS